MSGSDVARCAGPGCGRPLTRLATGRPARYCGPNCRKAAQRERDRVAEAERQRAAARAAVGRAWRPLEEDVHEVGELAAAVLACAAGDDRRSLAAKLAEFREAARRVEAFALEYFDATALVARLSPPGTAARVPRPTPRRRRRGRGGHETSRGRTVSPMAGTVPARCAQGACRAPGRVIRVRAAGGRPASPTARPYALRRRRGRVSHLLSGQRCNVRPREQELEGDSGNTSNRRRIPGRKADPGRYTVRHPPGTYLVRYAHSAPFTVEGRLGMTGGGSVGVNPVIVRPDGQVMILDPRAVITLDGRRVYGPRDLAADDHDADMRSWLAGHPDWDR